MAAKTDNSLPALLSNLTASLNSALEIVPDQDTILPPKDGISLLDVKNELLLSYLQNLVFLILLKIKNAPGIATDDTTADASDLNDQVVKKLVELRLYLEKGVRPLEAKLKYQIDKVVRAAEDAARLEAQNSAATKANGHAKADKGGEAGSDESEEGSEDNTSESGSDDEDDNEDGKDVDELAYRPNPAAFARPAATAETRKKKGREEAEDGIYRPPRITATAMPEHRDRNDDKTRRGPMKSAAIDEFIAAEMSGAPVAEPSIGSTIVSGGRRTKSARERQEEDERRVYEETNMVRLPKESKKERAKKGKRFDQRGGFGGEEWRDLGAGLNRIERLTAKKSGKSGAAGALDRSRKRAVEDGPRADGGGAEAGAMFAKRRKTLKKRM